MRIAQIRTDSLLHRAGNRSSAHYNCRVTVCDKNAQHPVEIAPGAPDTMKPRLRPKSKPGFILRQIGENKMFPAKSGR